MSKLLLIGLVFIISVSLNCAVQLIPICKNSTFIHSGIEVNSVHKLQYNRTFMQVSNYTIDTKINFDDYFRNDSQNAEKMNIYKKSWNNIFLGVFTEKFINKPDNFAKLSTYKSKEILEVAKKYLEECKKEKKQSFNDSVILKLKNSLDFHMTLEYLSRNEFDQNNKTIDEVEKLLKSLKVEDHQTLAFEIESIEDVYESTRILSLDKFILNRVGGRFFDLRNTGTLFMNIMIPFNDKNYEESTNCISYEKLPRFYRK